MNDLRHFATFVKNEKLDEFVTANLQTVRLFNVPLLRFFSHLSEEELKATGTTGAIEFLSSLETGTALEKAKESIENWRNNNIPGIPKQAIEMADLVLIYAAQKSSLLSLLPSYNLYSSDAVTIVLELEKYYKEVQDLALDTLKSIQLEEQQKLLESEERYRDLFNNANDLVHFVTPAGIIIHVNNAWLNTLGYSADELEGKSILSFVRQSDAEAFKEYRESLLRGESKSVGITTCYISKTGQEISVEGFITCKFKDGQPQYTRGILRDVSKRVENEQKIKFYTGQLVEREENLKQLIQNAPDAIIVINAQSIIQLWNPKSAMVFGWTAEEVIGTDLTVAIIPLEYREAHYTGMARLLTTGVSRVLNKTIEITAIKKTGEQFYISLTISQSAQAGEVVFIAFARDIDQQKKIELELENKRMQLEKSNQELEQYAWLASHDLKEPLRKILTFSDILLTRHSKILPGEVQELLKKIKVSSRRMDVLIEAVLEYSNVADHHELFVPVDLTQLVKEILIDLELQIQKTKATITIDPLPTIEAIPVQMRQLFQNLVSNALKYGKPGVAPLVQITSYNVNERCIINIRDNGIGFDNKYAEKIFQVFQRLSPKQQDGTGIGLSLCRKITETHNGTITAQSEEGVGTVFEINLPLTH